MTERHAQVAGPLLFAISRTRVSTIAGLCVVAIGWLLLAGNIVPVPLIAGSPTVPLEPLLPAGLAILLGMLCGEPMPEIEETVGPRPRTMRMAWAAVLLVAGLAVALALDALVDPRRTDTTVQSWLSFAGVALLSVWLLGSALSWAGPVSLLTALLFAGKDQFDDARQWAWLLRVEETGAAGVVVSAGIMTAGAFVYTAGGLPLVSRTRLAWSGWAAIHARHSKVGS